LNKNDEGLSVGPVCSSVGLSVQGLRSVLVSLSVAVSVWSSDVRVTVSVWSSDVRVTVSVWSSKVSDTASIWSCEVSNITAYHCTQNSQDLWEVGVI